MVENQVGGKKYPITETFGGQKVWVYKNYYAFILDNHPYFKAGKKYWPHKYKTGQLSSPGIGINIPLYKAVMANRDKSLYVYDKKDDTWYKLTDYKMVVDNAVKGNENVRPLMIIPLDAFRKVNGSNLDTNLKRLSSRR